MSRAKKKIPPKKWVAYHEAGHVVGHLVLMNHAPYTSIIPNVRAGRAGWTAGTKKPIEHWQIWPYAIMCAAGDVAEGRCRHNYCTAWHPGSSDHVAIDEAMKDRTMSHEIEWEARRYAEIRVKEEGKPISTEKVECFRQVGRDILLELATKRFVNMYWPQIERVAKALLKHRKLAGAQVRKAAGCIPKQDISVLWTQKLPRRFA